MVTDVWVTYLGQLGNTSLGQPVLACLHNVVKKTELSKYLSQQ